MVPMAVMIIQSQRYFLAISSTGILYNLQSYCQPGILWVMKTEIGVFGELNVASESYSALQFARGARRLGGLGRLVQPAIKFILPLAAAALTGYLVFNLCNQPLSIPDAAWISQQSKDLLNTVKTDAVGAAAGGMALLAGYTVYKWL